LVIFEGREAGSEVNRSPLSTAAVRNGWNYISTSIYAFTSWTWTTLLLRSTRIFKVKIDVESFYSESFQTK